MDTPKFLLRLSLLLLRILQWASAVIVMGIASYFIAQYDHEGLVIYTEVIAVLSVAFFLPGLISPFLPKIGFVPFAVDLIFSYLWITSFILQARDYRSGGYCAINAPPGAKCSLKRANEAFAFIAFFCCFASAFLEARNLYLHRSESANRRGFGAKEAPRQSGDTAVASEAA
ncbi:hypothetical protein VTO42DRAFT_783 [Malbranchea cinnamomea]